MGRDHVVGRGRLRQLGELLLGLGPLQIVALRLDPGLGDEHVDLGQLAIERGHLRRGARGDVGEGALSRFVPGTMPRLVDQSSGIRIQPWRIA